MNMMQVRWSLNGQSATKRKTLACDYNPIEKRLRDFGHEAQELVHNSAGKAMMMKPVEKVKKKESTASAVWKLNKQPDALASLPPVSMSSIVNELQGAGLLKNPAGGVAGPALADAALPLPEGVAPAPAHNNLSLGVAGLLGAAGLLPGASILPSTDTSAADAGGEAPISETSSSFEGGDAASMMDGMDGMLGDVDPFLFLRECDVAGLSSPPRKRAAGASREKAADGAGAFDWAGAAQGVVSMDEMLGGGEASSASQMLSGQGMVAVLPWLPPTPSSSKDADATCSAGEGTSEDPSSLSRQSTADTVIASSPRGDRVSTRRAADREFEALANELETDNSHSLLHELHGMYDLDDEVDAPEHAIQPPSPGSHVATHNPEHGGIDAQDLLFDLQAGDDKVSLLHDLSTLPVGDDGASIFAGFDGAGSIVKSKPKDKAKQGGEAKGRGGKSKGGSKASGEAGATGGAASAKAAEPKKPPKAVWAQQHALPPPPRPQPAPAPQTAMRPPAARPDEYWTHPSMLPPAPKSGVKFLPGAVATPAPPPTKQSLSGAPPVKGTAGRSFSWQPIKMPVYK